MASGVYPQNRAHSSTKKITSSHFLLRIFTKEPHVLFSLGARVTLTDTGLERAKRKKYPTQNNGFTATATHFDSEHKAIQETGRVSQQENTYLSTCHIGKCVPSNKTVLFNLTANVPN